jgi:hypothetical protein
LKFSVFVVVLLCLVVSVSFAAVRVSEPAIFQGNQLAVFDGSPVDDLHLFAFENGFWYELPLQIDERNSSGSFFGSDEGLLDGNDELVCQPQDFGSVASAGNWIDDAESKTYQRIGLTITDPVTGDLTVGYIFRSSTLPDNPDTYITYNDADDEILTDSYLIGFDNDNWFWDELRLFDGSSYSVDLLDREKTRIKGEILWTDWTRNEQDFSPIEKRVVAGSVRVIRETKSSITVFGFTTESVMTKHYYDSFIATPEDVTNIDSAAGVNMIRLSYDLTPAAIGTVESNMNNTSLLADGNPDSPNTDLPTSEMHHFWIKINLNGDSLVSVGNQAGMSNNNQLYYYDDSSGGAADPTSDTGDGASYGDIGIRMNNPNSGSHTTSTNMYMALSADLSGTDCRDWFDNGFGYTFVAEDFDNTSAIAPVMLASNLRNAPNPFNPSTEIRFQLSVDSSVELTLYDATGRMVRTLHRGNLSEGEQTFNWNGKDQFGRSVSSGTYFARLHGQNIDLVKSMSLIK